MPTCTHTLIQMCVHLHVYLYTCTYACIYRYTHTCAYAPTCTHAYDTRICVRMCTHVTSTCTHIRTQV